MNYCPSNFWLNFWLNFFSLFGTTIDSLENKLSFLLDCTRMAELYSTCVYYVYEYIYVCVSLLSLAFVCVWGGVEGIITLLNFKIISFFPYLLLFFFPFLMIFPPCYRYRRCPYLSLSL